jgi:hypothetical protein
MMKLLSILMWILLIIAVHLNDPTDRPAKLEMTFPTEQQCQAAADTLKYDLKFKQFKLEATCSQKK